LNPQLIKSLSDALILVRATACINGSQGNYYSTLDPSVDAQGNPKGCLTGSDKVITRGLIAKAKLTPSAGKTRPYIASSTTINVSDVPTLNTFVVDEAGITSRLENKPGLANAQTFDAVFAKYWNPQTLFNTAFAPVKVLISQETTGTQVWTDNWRRPINIDDYQATSVVFVLPRRFDVRSLFGFYYDITNVSVTYPELALDGNNTAISVTQNSTVSSISCCSTVTDESTTSVSTLCQAPPQNTFGDSGGHADLKLLPNYPFATAITVALSANTFPCSMDVEVTLDVSKLQDMYGQSTQSSAPQKHTVSLSTTACTCPSN
jgi:hypothetical protein